MGVVDLGRRLVGAGFPGHNQPDPAPALAPRDVLRLALASAATAAQAMQDAAAAAGRGQAARDAAQAALALHDGLDAQVARHTAGLLRTGEPSGSAALPADLVAARRARAAALEALDDATAVFKLLSSEARDAAAAAEAARAAARAAADAVMQESALAMLAELRQREASAARLRVVVTALVGSRAAVDPALPWAVLELVHEPAHGHLTGPRADWAGATAAWRAFAAALAANPAATFEMPT